MEDSKMSEIQSCEPTMTRQQFFQASITRAKAAGVLLIAPMIAETFLVPAAFAAASSCTLASTNGLAYPDTNTANDFVTCCPLDQGTAAGHVEASCSQVKSDTGISGDPTSYPGKTLCFKLQC
jgi:hypothetical protein